MEPLTHFTAIAVPLPGANIDTDQIVPARYLSRPREEGFASCLFHDLRFTARGREKEAFVLNRPTYKAAKILVAGANFGCGSSREQAVYALYDYGFRAVIAPSLGDIFRMNCFQNGLAPIVLPETAVASLVRFLSAHPGAVMSVDIAKTEVIAPDGTAYAFAMDPFQQGLLLAGREALDVTLEAIADVVSFEATHKIF